jgi:hypothetical protein
LSLAHKTQTSYWVALYKLASYIFNIASLGVCQSMFAVRLSPRFSEIREAGQWVELGFYMVRSSPSLGLLGSVIVKPLS